MCKQCVSEYARKRYIEKRDSILEKNSNYRKSIHGKLVMKKCVKSWREKYPEQRLAHTAVFNAIQSGKLIKKPCSVCGSRERVEGHHKSYEEKDRLKVIWLCKKHHLKIHNKEIYELV